MDKIIRIKNFKRTLSVESDTDMSGDEGSDTLQDHLCLAEKEDRLIQGIFESAHVLELCPEIVEVCILPSGSKQVISTDIQHKLIRAFCLEHDIKIVVLAKTYLNDMFKAQRSKVVENSDMDCVLITSKPFIEEGPNDPSIPVFYSSMQIPGSSHMCERLQTEICLRDISFCILKKEETRDGVIVSSDDRADKSMGFTWYHLIVYSISKHLHVQGNGKIARVGFTKIKPQLNSPHAVAITNRSTSGFGECSYNKPATEAALINGNNGIN